MKRIVVIFSVVALVSAGSTLARAEQVIVINPDGSVTISDPSGNVPEQKLEKRKPAAPEAPRAPLPVPIKQPGEPVVEKTPVPTAKPVAKPSAKTVVAVPPPSPEKPVKKERAPSDVKPDPGIPAEQSIGRVDPSRKPEPRSARPVGPEEAKRIALDVAPPALAVDVYPADYSGTKVWQVIFKTEEGERYVLVERATGAIIRE